MIFNEINNYVDLYYERGLSIWDIKSYIDITIKENYQNFDDFFIAYLLDALNQQNAEQVENANLFMFHKQTFVKDKRVLNLYHSLLLETWHSRQEDIISIIEEFNNESSIEYLFNAFGLDVKELSIENYYSFHRKLIWGIYKIGGKKYKAELSNISKKINPELRIELKQLLAKLK